MKKVIASMLALLTMFSVVACRLNKKTRSETAKKFGDFHTQSIQTSEMKLSVPETPPSELEETTTTAGLEDTDEFIFVGTSLAQYIGTASEVIIPDGVTSIADSAFCGCVDVTSIYIPNSVIEIGTNAFAGCSGLVTIAVDSSNPSYCSESDVLFDKAKAVLILYPSQKTEPSYTIPDGVTTIGYSAFAGNAYLEELNIPSSVVNIDSGAFSGCAQLTIEAEESSYATEFARSNGIPLASDRKAEIKTIPPYIIPDSFQYDDSLEYLNYSINTIDRRYGAFERGNDNAYYVSENVEVLDIQNNADIDLLVNEVQGVFDELIQRFDSEYDVMLQNFIEKETYSLELETKSCGSSINVMRADSAFCSFYVSSGYYSDYASWNYVTSTGEKIELQDVLKDEDQFCSYFKSNFTRLLISRTQKSSVDDVIARVHDGSLPFTLCYDGIQIYVDGVPFKISALANESMFNMKYFGATPKSYMLEIDATGQLCWDLNGDGSNENMYFGQTWDDENFEFGTYTFDVNGVKTEITPDDLNVSGSYASIEEGYLVRTESGFYFCIACSYDDSYQSSYVFKLNDDFTVTYQSIIGVSCNETAFNPGRVVMGDSSNIGGACFEENEYTFLETEGEVVACDSYHSRRGRVMETKMSLVATTCNGRNEEVTIPTGTIVDLVGYDLELQLIYMETLNADESENGLYQLPLTEENYDYYIAGMSPRDLFRGCIYGG